MKIIDEVSAIKESKLEEIKGGNGYKNSGMSKGWYTTLTAAGNIAEGLSDLWHGAVHRQKQISKVTSCQ